MRIAISGTHCCGKSTLIDEFLITHPEYTHEREAYETMQDELGESFAAEPSSEDFRRQLEHCVNRLEQYRESDDVIFERCPADYLAYMLALRELGRDSQAAKIAVESMRTARSGIKALDVVVLLRSDAEDDAVSDEDDLELRAIVDEKLESILVNNELNLFDELLSVEASGSTSERLEALELACGE